MHDEYMSVFKNLISDLTDLLTEYKKEEIRIVIAGDLVHQKIVISNEQLMLGTWFLRKLEEIAPVIIIAGNHDLLENNKDRIDSISPMVQFLFDKNINYFKESKCYLDNNIVWCVYSIFEGNSRPDIEAAKLQFGEDKTYIGLFHGPLVGSTTDIGYEIEHGYNLDIFKGCDMVMCGDIHKRGVLIFKETKEIYEEELYEYEKIIPVVMPSSLIQQNFGENVSKHGFLLWDVETKTFTEHDVENKSPFYQFKIKSLEDLDNGTEVLTNL
jgi:DNA repair exonuclease SbcCD nuclease subunit